MGNMSYCRFENTSLDMSDCIDALDENDWDIEKMKKEASSKQEARCIDKFLRLCKQVAENVDD